MHAAGEALFLFLFILPNEGAKGVEKGEEEKENKDDDKEYEEEEEAEEESEDGEERQRQTGTVRKGGVGGCRKKECDMKAGLKEEGEKEEEEVEEIKE